MSTAWLWGLGHLPGWLLLAIHVALQVFFVGRALLRPHREPASRLAWVVVIIVAPVVGMLAYVLFGETNIGRRRIARFKRAMARLPSFAAMSRHEGEARAEADIEPRYKPLFRVGQSISGFPPVGGNRGRLLGDSDDVIDHIVADIDAARDHVHICFYIWLADQNGLKVVDALKRAAERGVTCRAMADDLGSRAMVRSEHWRGDGGGRRPPRRGAADRLPAVAPAQGPDRHAQPPQDRGRRQPRHLLRLEQLRRRRLRDQAALRSLGRRDDALRGPDRAAEPARLRHRLDGARQGGPERPVRRAGRDVRGRLPRPGHRHRRHRPLLGDARDVRVADVRRPPRAHRDHPLLRPRRADPGSPLRQRSPRRSTPPSFFRRGTTAGSSPPPATATTPSCSTPACGSSSTSAACCTPSR